MGNKKRSNDLKASLEKVRQIDWFDSINKLPNNMNKELLDQCSDLIEEFLNSDEKLSKSVAKSKPKSQKQQVSKIKKSKTRSKKPEQSKVKSTCKKIKTNAKQSNKTAQSFHYNNITSNACYPCYPSAFPCFRSCGPINCPEDKLPMPRDLWYRIVYSQALDQQLGSGEVPIAKSPSISYSDSSSKRKHTENQSLTDKSSINNLNGHQSNSNNSPQNQTANATLSNTSTKIIKLDTSFTLDDSLHKSEFNQKSESCDKLNSFKDFQTKNLQYVPETLPLQTENEENHSNLWNAHSNNRVSSTQSAHIELLNRPKMLRKVSVDDTLETLLPIPSVPSASIFSNNQSSFKNIISKASSVQLEQSNNQLTKDNSHTDSSITLEHPIMNELFERYNFKDIPRHQLFKQLNRRLVHVRQSLKTMTSNDIQMKLKSKHDTLLKRRQTPAESLTKDERIALAELELNVYEYKKALDEISDSPSLLRSNETILPVEEKPAISATSISTSNTIQPSATNHSTILLSTATQLSDKTDKFVSWNHPLLPNLMKKFQPMTSLSKAQIHRQLARRHEHMHKKAKELNQIELQAQIDAKSKALEQIKNVLQPNKDECLTRAELELCLYELENEQNQRNQIN